MVSEKQQQSNVATNFSSFSTFPVLSSIQRVELGSFSTKVLNTALALLLLSLSLILHIIRDVFKYFFIIIAVSASIVYSILFLFFLNKVFKVFEYSREKQTVFENQPKCFVKIQSFQMPSEFSRRNWPKLYFIKGDFFLVIFKYCEAREGFLSK